MSENPLAGISVPSMKLIAKKVVADMAENTLNLSNALARKRLESHIEHVLSCEMEFTLRAAIENAVSKSLKHVFRLMDDPDYQAKRALARVAARKQANIRREERKDREREARMNYSRWKFDVSKVPIQ